MDKQRRIRVRRDAPILEVVKKGPKIEVGSFVRVPGGAAFILQIYQVMVVIEEEDETEVVLERLLDGVKQTKLLDDVEMMTAAHLRMARVKYANALMAIQEALDQIQSTDVAASAIEDLVIASIAEGDVDEIAVDSFYDNVPIRPLVVR